MDEIREIFLQQVPPWDIKELACIHDYLHRRLSAIDGLELHEHSNIESCSASDSSLDRKYVS